MRYLLDTNAVSDLVYDPRGLVAARFRLMRAQTCTSVIVAAELRFGAERRDSRRLAERIEAVLESLPVLPLQPPADKHYGALRAWLEKKGTPISANDMLIAAHTLALGDILVTANEREFSRIPGLRVENWLLPPKA